MLFMVGIFLSTLLYSKYSFAQDKINAGLIFGAGVSSLHNNGYGANKVHFHAGIPVNFKLNEKFVLQSTVLLSSKGYSSSFFKPAVRMKLHYVDLIATLKYFPVKVLFLGGGLYTGGLISSSYKYLAYSNDYYGEPDISNIVNKFDYGINGSIGCQFDNGFGFEFSLMYGLQNVFNSNMSDTLVGYYGYPYTIPAEAQGKNMVISTSFYYMIGNKDF